MIKYITEVKLINNHIFIDIIIDYGGIMNYPRTRSTTILCVKKGNKVAIGGDGQVTLGETVVKSTAKKIRTMYDGKVITGFAGAVADAFTLYEKFEQKLIGYAGDLKRACIELTKEWRMDKYLRRLEAMLIVADKNNIFILSGNGDVIEPENNIASIGSGSNYARSAAIALMEHSKLNAKQIVHESMKIASGICIYTNNNILLEEING